MPLIYPVGFLKSSGLTTVIIDVQDTTVDLGGVVYTIWSRNIAIINGVTVSAIGYYSSVAETAKIKIGIRNSAGNYTVVADQSVSHTGSSTIEYFTLSSPYTVPGTGTYYVGKANTGNTGANNIKNITPRAYITTDQTGGPTGGYTENSSATYPMAYQY